MNLEETALQYATSISESLFRDALMQAYLKGYEDGYNSHKKVKTEGAELEEMNGVRYDDMHLPSGVLWSQTPKCNSYGYRRDINNVISIPYLKASNYNLPTEDQYKELLCNSKIKRVYDKNNELNELAIVTPSGNKLWFFRNLIIDSNGTRCFKAWLRSDVINNEAKVMYFDKDTAEIRTEFIGTGLPCWFTK